VAITIRTAAEQAKAEADSAWGALFNDVAELHAAELETTYDEARHDVAHEIIHAFDLEEHYAPHTTEDLETFLGDIHIAANESEINESRERLDNAKFHIFARISADIESDEAAR